MKLRDTADGLRLKKFWWRFNRSRPELYNRTAHLSRIIACSQVSSHHQFAIMPTGTLFANYVIVFASDENSFFSVLQSRVHEVWVRFFASSMKDDLRYTPSDCFETFPFLVGDDAHDTLVIAANAYLDHRASLMVAHNEGLTKTYNRFHNPSDRSPDIQRLRELHYELDLAVLHAYGWDDLAARAAPEFLTEETEPDHRYQGRLFWPASFRDEVLARLLDLNCTRVAEERRLGLSLSRVEDAEEEQCIVHFIC